MDMDTAYPVYSSMVSYSLIAIYRKSKWKRPNKYLEKCSFLLIAPASRTRSSCFDLYSILFPYSVKAWAVSGWKAWNEDERAIRGKWKLKVDDVALFQEECTAECGSLVSYCIGHMPNLVCQLNFVAFLAVIFFAIFTGMLTS